MRYVIYGAGGVGGVIAAKLSIIGADVAVIARGAHLQAIQQDGLRLKHPQAEKPITVRLPAYGHPNEIEFRPDDVVMLTVKSQDTQAVLNDLCNAAGNAITVVCCQNGVENERMALRIFANVYGIAIFMPAAHIEPGLVETSAWPTSGVLDIGRFPAGSDALCESIAADLSAAGFASEANPDIMALKYAKLLQNMVNAVQAVCGAANADDIVTRLRTEAEASLQAAGIEWSPGSFLSARTTNISRGRLEGWPGGSTLQSLLRGQGSVEVDYLNGEVVMLGRMHGVPTPANEVFQIYANRMAADRLPPGTYSPEHMRKVIESRQASLSAGV